MSLVVNTNVASMNAQRALMHSSRELHTAMERLSTGKKINSAADDAAGFAIAESMTAQIRGLSMAAKNASDGLSLMSVVENATNDVTDMLQRIRELAVQAKSGTNSTGDVANLQLEADALIKEIGRVSESTTYNGVAYIGSQANNISVQVGYNDNDTIQLTTYSVHAKNLGTTGGQKLETEVAAAAATNHQHTITLGDFSGWNSDLTVGDGTNSVTVSYAGDGSGAPANAAAIVTAIQAEAGYGNLDFTVAEDSGNIIYNWTTAGVISGTAQWASAQAGDSMATTVTGAAAVTAGSNYLDISSANALTTISDAINQVAKYKADWGASQNRLEYTVSNLMNVVEFTSAARSRIQDADFAMEAARLAKAQVLQQTGTAMLAQANASPQLAISLIT